MTAMTGAPGGALLAGAYALPWDALRLSFLVATAATILALLLSIALCALLNRPFRGRGLIDAILTLPLVLPPTVLGYYLLTLLSRRSPLGQLFEVLFGAPLTFTRLGAVVAATVQAAPLCYRGLRAALDEVDPLLQHAARCLGASEARILWTITLPLARRGAAAACALAFARALGDFGVTLMIAGNIPGETRTAALAIYDAVQAGREREAAVLAAVLAVLALLMLLLVNALGHLGLAGQVGQRERKG